MYFRRSTNKPGLAQAVRATKYKSTLRQSKVWQVRPMLEVHHRRTGGKGRQRPSPYWQRRRGWLDILLLIQGRYRRISGHQVRAADLCASGKQAPNAYANEISQALRSPREWEFVICLPRDNAPYSANG